VSGHNVTLMSAAGRTTTGKAKSLKAKLWLRWVFLWPIMVGLVIYPVSNAFLRAISIVIGFLLVCGILFFYWRYRWLRFSTLSIVGIVAIFLALPGRSAQPQQLRQRYLNALENYSGTRYIWGGEGRLGIDCSGLVRGGLISAVCPEFHVLQSRGGPASNPIVVERLFSPSVGRRISKFHQTLV
jgi:hypothetical protein